MPPTTLITGANRGIGLEFARQLRGRGYNVIGTARRESDTTDLAEHAHRIEAVDVADASSIAAFAERLVGTPIDLLINSAGVFLDRYRSLRTLDAEAMIETYRINSVGPLLITNALLPNLTASDAGESRVVVISSAMGSIELARERGAADSYGYRGSKSAVNMHTALMGHELREDRVACIAIHPGWVRTRMGTDAAALSTEESVTSMLKTIESVTLEDTGSYYNYDGSRLPN